MFLFVFRSLRKRRTVRDARSADVGVSGIYEVVSENDLDFGPTRREPVTVFSGKIREEVKNKFVYELQSAY